VSAGGKLDILKQNYEKFAVIVVLAALMLSALYLVLKIGHVRKSLDTMDADNAAVQKQPVEAVDEEAWSVRLGQVGAPFQAGASSNQMMVSELRVYCVACEQPIPYHAVECPFCGEKQPDIKDITKVDSDADGLPDQFELAHELNPFVPEDAQRDADEDGFTNLEEYQWETDLADPNSFPSPAAKLRLAAVADRPFMLRFQGVNELATGKRFLLNMRSLDQSYFAKIGETVQGFEVISFEERFTTNAAGKKIDVSVLTLRKDGKDIPLVKNRARTRHERIAKLVFLIDRSSYRVRVGDTIDLKGRQYKVIDIRPDGVLIRDMQTRKDTQVVRVSEAEIKRLRGTRSSTSGGGLRPTGPTAGMPGAGMNQNTLQGGSLAVPPQ
jgi:hypothetical protein